MPKVHTKAKRNTGRRIVCGRCGEEILPGETYRSWSFYRQRTPNVRCYRSTCDPRPSELTSSIVSDVLSAIEDAQEQLAGEFAVEDAESAVEAIKEAAEAARDQYSEAAEPFNGEGIHQERADGMESFATEVEGVEVDNHPGDDEPVLEIREGVPEGEPPSELRDRAVLIVDRKRGYAIEFSHSPDEQRDEYDETESLLQEWADWRDAVRQGVDDLDPWADMP